MLFRSQEKEGIEFITHTSKDIREDTLFLILDEADGKTTYQLRQTFPEHQMITIVAGCEVNIKEPATLWVDYEIMVDDPDDDDLPLRTHKSDRLFSNSDISGQEQIVQDIFNIVFNK